ncbi:MAG: VacJ family lipoprotein, partial [Pelagibacteraceae bacterium]|nr:VacJ family lipoprotein [Pelagibacteraceae bacterium]
SDDFETTVYEDEVYDPFEGVNRAIFSFNNSADKVVLEPIAKGYKKLPPPIQSGVGNFINNLKLPLAAVNQLLQGQGKNAMESTGRFLVNSTIGIFGLIDVADDIGLNQKEEDFGQTLATWGVGDGFYIVLPLFGPSNLRDTTGMLMTMMTDPINAYAASQGEAWAIPMRTAANAIDQRSQIIDEVNALRNNSVDYYAAVRSSYYQNRKAAIMNTDDDVLTPLPLISIEFE